MRNPLSLGVIATAALLMFPVMTSANTTVAQAETEFICENSGAGLSAVDVLEATGDHDVFLEYLSEYDPEGYQILTDPAASDKTIWAPTDAAFAKLGDAPESASPEEIKAVLGYHITPPRRTPEGDYPIVTFEYLADGGQIIHQTRTGILTESDQRVRTTVEDGVYTVEGIPLGPTAWCTQAGSIFSIDTVITEVATPSWLEQILGQAIYFVFFQNPLVSALVALGLAALLGFLIIRVMRRRRST
jgi:uncharacterized surface protein with fasciclin (FAS1) repeats